MRPNVARSWVSVDWSWSNIKTRVPRYLADKKIIILVQGAFAKEPDLPDVPWRRSWTSSTTTISKVMELFLAQKAVARPVLAPPEIPAPRVAALRKALMDMAQDADFKADAAKTKLEIDVTSGESVDAVVKRIVATPQAMADRLSAAIAPPGGK